MNTQAPLLELQDINAACGMIKLEIYTMKVFPGLVYQITGNNGSGKSLLLNILGHRRSISKGDILYNGKSRQKREYNKRLLLDRMSFLSQKRPFWPGGKVISCLQRAGRNKNKSAAIAWQEAMTLLEKFDLKHLTERSRRELTPTLFKKIELIRILLENKEILLLDDPYSGLDDGFIRNYNYFLRDLVKKEKRTVIIANAGSLVHFKIVDLLMTLNNGRIVKVEKPQFQGRTGGRPRRQYQKDNQNRTQDNQSKAQENQSKAQGHGVKTERFAQGSSLKTHSGRN